MPGAPAVTELSCGSLFLRLAGIAGSLGLARAAGSLGFAWVAGLAGSLGLMPRINLLTTQQLEQSLQSTNFAIIEKIKFSDQPDAEFTLIARKH